MTWLRTLLLRAWGLLAGLLLRRHQRATPGLGPPAPPFHSPMAGASPRQAGQAVPKAMLEPEKAQDPEYRSWAAAGSTTSAAAPASPTDAGASPLAPPPRPAAAAPRAPRPRRPREDHPPIPEDVPAAPRTVRKPRKPRAADVPPKPRRVVAQTLADLLDGIERTFDAVTAPIDRCEISHDSRVGFRRLGPHVMPVGYKGQREVGDDLEDWPTTLPPNPKRHFSAMMFVAFPRRFTEDGGAGRLEDWSYGCFFYAHRLDRVPWDVAQETGAPTAIYAAGVGWRGFASKKVYWSQFYAAVLGNGQVHVLPQRLLLPIRLPRTAAAASYTRKIWDVPCAYAQTHWGDKQWERQQCLARWFTYSFQAWEHRERMWTVSVRRDNLRATFCVEPHDTAAYFRDREMTALTPTGQRKRIIHAVSEHQRERNGRPYTVREHIRGERSFDWRGYHCAVTAPAFHTWSTHEFATASHEYGPNEEPKGTIPTSALAGALAQLEDTQRSSVFKRALKVERDKAWALEPPENGSE